MILDLILILIYDMLVRLHVLAILKLHMRLAQCCVKLYYSTFLGGAACEGLPCNRDRDAVRKIRIKPLRENNVWVAQG